jgi:hypothetical protein
MPPPELFRLKLQTPRFALWEIMAAVVLVALALVIPAGMLPVLSILIYVFLERVGLTLAQILVALSLLGLAIGMLLPPIIAH